jgi:hypothetical protein
MSEQQNQAAVNQNTAASDYGYASDEVKVSPFNFGLNAGVTHLIKFEWIPNGGKDGAEQEALDVVFNINGTEKSYRMFPVTQAFKKGTNEKITDRNAPEFKEAVTDFNARVKHIVGCFVNNETIMSKLSVPITSFKQFIQLYASLLPANFKEIPLDIFLQFEWNLRDEQKRTYLNIPNKMKYGKWLMPAQAGTWEARKKENPTEDDKKALWYVNTDGPKNEKGEYTQEHPFFKNGWFMNSTFAKQQRAEGEGGDNADAHNTSNTPADGSSITQNNTNAAKSAW